MIKFGSSVEKSKPQSAFSRAPEGSFEAQPAPETVSVNLQ